MTRSGTPAEAKRTLIAAIIALVLASVSFRLMRSTGTEHTALVFIGIPALVAFALTAVQPKTGLGTAYKTIALALCLSGIVFAEGFICILMASPLFFLVGTIVMKMSKRAGPLPRGDEGERGNDGASGDWKRYGVVLLVPMCLEGVLPGFEFSREEVIRSSRVIAASAAQVEMALASPMHFDRTLPLLFRLGFPTPGATSGSGLRVGDRRAIEFLHGQHHPGTLVLQVVESEPGLVVFRAMSDDSYITHWLAWHSAEIRWQEIRTGETRVTWTLRYARRLDPAFYFTPLERYGVSLAATYLIETLATPGHKAGHAVPTSAAITKSAARVEHAH